MGSTGDSQFNFGLDRTPAWNQLVNGCEDVDRNRAFVVHGTSEQNIEYFLQRLLYTGRQIGRARSHRVIEVTVALDDRRPLTPTDWARRVRAGAGALHEDLHGALEDATRHEPVIFLFGDGARPLQSRRSSPIGLDETERAGLCTFLEQTLPDALGACELANAVRVIVPVEHPAYSGADPGDDLFVGVERALERAPGLDYERIDELTRPLWPEVWNSIRRNLARIDSVELPEAAKTACHKAYNNVGDDKTFAELAAALFAALAPYRRTHS